MMRVAIFLAAGLLPACTYITIVQGDAGEAGAEDASTDSADSAEADKDSAAQDGALLDANEAGVVDVRDDHIYCWHFAQNTSTWPNGPYKLQAALACGSDAGGEDWGAGQVNQSPVFSCHILKCPNDDTVNNGMACAWGGYGSICCPELHAGGCQ